MATALECGDRGTPEPVSSPSDTIHELQSVQLGRSLHELSGIRDVVGSREVSLDQHAGAPSCRLGPRVISTILARKMGIGGIGQHLHSGAHQSTGGNTFHDCHGPDIQPVQCGSVLRDDPKGSPHSWQAQQNSGSSVSIPSDCEHRVDAPPPGGNSAVDSLGSLDDRSDGLTELTTRLSVYVSPYPDP